MRSAFFLIALASSSAYADGVPTLQLQNLIGDCADISLSQPYLLRKQAFVDADVVLIRATGRCGCTSKALAYHLVSGDGSLIYHARFDLVRSGKKRLYLGKASVLERPHKVSLRIGCAGA